MPACVWRPARLHAECAGAAVHAHSGLNPRASTTITREVIYSTAPRRGRSTQRSPCKQSPLVGTQKANGDGPQRPLAWRPATTDGPPTECRARPPSHATPRPACHVSFETVRLALDPLRLQILIVRAAEVDDRAARLQLDDPRREAADELAVVRHENHRPRIVLEPDLQ